MELKDRIKEVRKNAALSQEDFSARINVARSTLANFELGERIPKDIHIKAICREFGVREEWLRDGILPREVFIADRAIKELAVKYDLDELDQKLIMAYVRLTPNQKDAIKVYIDSIYLGSVGLFATLVEQKISADEEAEAVETVKMKVFYASAAAGSGNPLFDDSDESFEMLSFPSDEIPKHAGFGIRINGDSMEPEIADKSIVWIQATKTLNNGEVGIFILNGKAYCKKYCFEYVNGKEKISLVSYNINYEPIKISRSDSFEAVGRVL